VGGANRSLLTYAYDNDDNITGITDGVTAANSVAYGYDVRGRLAQASLAGASTAPFKRTDYVFDANGNRTTVERRVNAADASASETDLYTRTAGTNRLASLSTPAGLRSLTPDARGNLTAESRPGGIAVNAGYDGYGRLISYARTGNPTLTHSYNGLDDRVSTTTGTGAGADTRRFVYAPDGRVLGEYGTSATDVKAEFIWLNPQVGDGGTFGGDDGLGGYMPLAVVTTGGTLSWVHSDHLGTPILLTNATGAAIAQPSGYSTPAFPGQSKTLADLYYNRHRDYDPTTGRYIQADPIGLEGGASPYSYAMNNPLRYTDPYGLETYWEHYTGLPDSYRRNAINVIAGISDSATFGATYQVRHWIGVNRDVNRCSSYYRGGEFASLFIGGARLAYAGTAKLGSRVAAGADDAVAFRNGLKRTFRFGFFPNYRMPSIDAIRATGKYADDTAIIAAAGRTNLRYNAIGAAAAVGGGWGLSNGCGCQ
jgi:RHS repeat-associated protein